VQKVDQIFSEHNLYCSSVYSAPSPVFSVDDMSAAQKGQAPLDAYLESVRTSPAIVSTAPGIEEAFGLFTGASPDNLKGLQEVADYSRRATGKPIMVGHGGYWNRLEFEKAPFFDIYDPETEPWYPANLHTDLQPLVNGRAAVIWLRPQMYEDVPYERWRFHAYVELMRGCRGWQFAHGPGDASLFRGLHGEMEFMKPIVASNDSGPAVDVQPWFEHWSRRRDGKTYVLAATTHGLTFGTWKWDQAGNCPTGRARVTSSQAEVRNEANSYGIGASAVTGPAVHGIQYLPGARTWPAGTKLVQWVQTDAAAPPTNLLTFIKSDGRWTHAAAWGTYDLASLRADPKRSYWFLQTFYRHADGFLGWDTSLVGKAMEYVPQDLAAMGAMPRPGEWIKLELPLEQVKAVGGLIDGVGSLHEGGIIRWGHTSLVEPDGQETVLWGDDIQLAPSQLAKVHIRVKGLHVAAKVKVLFEDRDLTAAEGEFTDDFRGADLYQRFGGGYGTGYGDAPVAFHGYEIQP